MESSRLIGKRLRWKFSLHWVVSLMAKIQLSNSMLFEEERFRIPAWQHTSEFSFLDRRFSPVVSSSDPRPLGSIKHFSFTHLFMWQRSNCWNFILLLVFFHFFAFRPKRQREARGSKERPFFANSLISFSFSQYMATHFLLLSFVWHGAVRKKRNRETNNSLMQQNCSEF